MEKHLFEKVQNTSEISNENEDKNNQEINEKNLLKEIENKILNKEVCAHSFASLMYHILKQPDKEFFTEEQIEKGYKKALGALGSLFQIGIWSKHKMWFDQDKGGGITKNNAWNGFDNYTQEDSWRSSVKINEFMEQYIKQKKEEGLDPEQIHYEAMISALKLSGKETRRSDKNIINSPRLKVAFKFMKMKNKGRLSEFMSDINHYFGTNLISSFSPERVLSDYKKGKIYGVDKLTILFKKPKEIHTHPLNITSSEVDENFVNELGIANKILPKDFIAVAFDLDPNKIPSEVLDIIPKNLPIISSDLKKVIRMPITNDEIE